MNKTYKIKYEIVFNNGDILKDKEINVKNCLSDLQAKIKLEDYLKRHYENFSKLIVISCNEDIFSQFGNIFSNGSSNPFGNGFSQMFGGKK